MTTLQKTLKAYTARLELAGVDSPRLSAELLLATALDVERADLVKRLVMQPETPLTDATQARADSFIARREHGEPVAYITGVKEFYGRDFRVTRDTLIPRPDTETLVDAALAFAAQGIASPAPSFIDLGTGSGAIAVTLALELPTWQGTAMDISLEALTIAQQNACALKADSLRFILGDFCSDIPHGPFDMVVTNPPYVSESEYRSLAREITLFEPKSALVPPILNASGLEHLRKIMTVAASQLYKGGLLLMEMGCTQGEALLKEATASDNWVECSILSDLANLPRVFSARRA